MTLFSSSLSHRPWRWWILFLVLVLAIFLPSVGILPVVWQDEVQFVDWGRVMFDPHTDWAVTWSAHAHKALLPISYLGCIGEELAFRLTGTVLGPRLFCIAGGFLLGTFVLALMMEQRRPVLLGLVFAGLIVLDPALIQSYRSGRLDVMALAFVLAGAFCVQRYVRKQDGRWLVAGALALGCAPYFWVRSIMALPAGLLPLIFATGMPSRKLWRAMLALIALTVVTGALLLPPAWEGLRETRMLANSPIDLFRDLAGNGEPKGHLVIPQMLDDIWECFFIAVPLLLFAVIGLFASIFGKGLDLARKTLLGLVVAATLLLQFKLTTNLHHYTALYLVPLLVLLAGHGMGALAATGRTIRLERWTTTGMALLLIGLLVDQADKSYNAWLDRANLGPDALASVVKALPSSPRRLIVGDFRLYFLLRSSGFQPFYLFTDLDFQQHQFRAYAPYANSDFQPFYLFNRTDKTGHGEIFSPESVPAMLSGGSSIMHFTWWAEFFEKQLRHPQVRQLPRGYRYVMPAAN